MMIPDKMAGSLASKTRISKTTRVVATKRNKMAKLNLRKKLQAAK